MIQLDEFYRIETDKNNFILKYEKPTGNINEKTGKEEISKDEWYYPKLWMALDKFSNESLKVPKDIKDLRIEMQRLTDLIKKTPWNLQRYRKNGFCRK